MSIVTLVDFSNQANTWLQLTSIDQSTGNQMHVAWDPITGVIQHDLSFNNYSGTISMPKLTVSTPEWNFNVAQINLKLDSQKNASGFSNKNRFETKNLSYTKLETQQVNLEDIAADIELSTTDGKLAVNLTASVANSQIAQQKFAQDNFKILINNIKISKAKNQLKKS